MLCASVDDEQVLSTTQLYRDMMLTNPLNRPSPPSQRPSRTCAKSSASSHATLSPSLYRDPQPYAALPHRLGHRLPRHLRFSYPRKLAFTYLADLAREFTTTYPASQVHSPALRPYAFMEFDTFISKTKTTYADSRASANLDKLNDELRDVTKVMTKNIEDLLYRGDSLERMGEISSRLRDDSKKYRRAAVRINWELLVKQYGPFAALGFIIIFFLYWRFF
ncbi:hypothetical protein Lal_00012503 [Lupinus albus]|nr:hypothetical protein Lal_00012503 [Lupinus albus]